MRQSFYRRLAPFALAAIAAAFTTVFAVQSAHAAVVWDTLFDASSPLGVAYSPALSNVFGTVGYNGQTITTPASLETRLDRFSVLYRDTSPGISQVRMQVYAWSGTDFIGLPVWEGSDFNLVPGSNTYVQYDFFPNVNLLPSTQYAVVARATDIGDGGDGPGGHGNIHMKTISHSMYGYPGGQAVVKRNDGTWTYHPTDAVFRMDMSLVPEPTSAITFVLAAGGLILKRRNRKAANMQRVTRTLVIFAACAMLFTGTTARADVSYTFDTSAEGWTGATHQQPDTPGGYAGNLFPFALSHSPTGGNPGGYVHAIDASGQDQFFRSPLSGDLSAYYAGNLGYDVRSNSAVVAQLRVAQVVLEGTNGTVLVFDSGVDPVPGNPVGNWTHFDVTLSESGWHSSSLAGPAATSGQFQSVLASLASMDIRSEYVAGADTGDLDNVSLAVPEPTNLMAIAPIVLVLRRAHRRRRAAKIIPADV